MTCFIDFETASCAIIKHTGARAYIDHPTTRVMCLAYAVGDEPPQVWWPEMPIPEDLQHELASGGRVAAHNYQFEVTVWRRFLVPLGWPDISLDRWDCTSFRARLERLPGGLGEAAEALGLTQLKDAAGKRFMQRITKRDLTTRPLTAAERARIDPYARQDVEVLRELDRVLPSLPDAWREVFDLDHSLNERGWPVDMDAVAKLITVRDAEATRLQANLVELTNGELESANQIEQLRKRLATLGVYVPDIQRETLEDWAEQNPKRDDLAAQLIHNRLDSSHSSDAKLDRIVDYARSTGRVRDGFVLHGAHTGRWSGKGVQLQNLKRVGTDRPEAALNRLIARADGLLAGTVDPLRTDGWITPIKESIADCLRAVFKAPDGWMYVSADLSQIEARVLAWIAGQEDKLAAYRDGRDVYRLEADNLGSDSRALGKLFTLSAGYGASGRVMFDKAPGFGVILTEPEAYELTEVWRATNANIVQFWYDLARTVRFVVDLPPDQEPVEFRCLRIWRDRTMLFVQLPSGRCLKYRNPRTELDKFGGPSLFVDMPKHKKLQAMSAWHGALTENVVSGISYDVMVAAMCRLHQDGIFLIGTIHDEIVALAPVEDAEAILDHMIRVMKTPPDWAPDVPLAADGFVNQRFVAPADPAHAPLAPSSAERWLNCPGSVAAVQAMPPGPESLFAAEGTEAHQIFAHCLERDVDPGNFTSDPLVLHPLRDALAIARDVIAGRRFHVEIRLDPIADVPKVWGTADVIVLDKQGRVVEILDLKFGATVAIEPHSLQLQIYALLAAQKYGCPPEGLGLHILQPRRQHINGPHRACRISTDDLQRLYTRLQAAVEAIEAPAAPRIPGEWCRYCAARQDCPEGRSTPLPQQALRNPFFPQFGRPHAPAI
jgi:DNA polymerase bacteriophage-type